MNKFEDKSKAAAKKYAEQQSSCYTNDYYGFINGVEWAMKNGIIVDGTQMTKDIVNMRELHNKVFLGQFTEQEAKEYEVLVNKYEGLDLLKIF